jgi:hypothetical protein
MKNTKLTIKINKPAKAIFDFTLDPKNTPKWIDAIREEETNEWPTKLGTIYRNRGTSLQWSEFEVTEIKEPTSFTLRRKDGEYSVRYVFTPITPDETELEYYEWTNQGELAEPFTLGPLKKLKEVIENRV